MFSLLLDLVPSPSCLFDRYGVLSIILPELFSRYLVPLTFLFTRQLVRLLYRMSLLLSSNISLYSRYKVEYFSIKSSQFSLNYPNFLLRLSYCLEPIVFFKDCLYFYQNEVYISFRVISTSNFRGFFAIIVVSLSMTSI